MITLLLLLFMALPARAQDRDAAYHEAAEEAADMQFSTVMMSNAYAPPAKQAAEEPLRALGYIDDGAPAPAAQAPAFGPQAPARAAPRATVPLDRYEDAREQLRALDAEAAIEPPPLVVLGASSFTGRAIDGALALDLDYRVTLTGEGLWKTVPLVGEGVVVVDARVDGRPIPLSRQSGYHVWITQTTGEQRLELQLLVPSQGRRGSLEYEFLIARTPVTRFDCTFPTEGLEPRLRSAVQAEITPLPGATRLTASLAPTPRIHLVGFRDMGDDAGREARVYAESLNLLSMDEGVADLFTVVRYNILYAGTKRFEVFVPEGLEVVSADGEGAFRYALEPAEGGGTVVKGETAFPIRNSYELSLRLRREIDASGAPFELALPRSQGVEREYGWLGVEVVGKLQLEETARTEVLAVDVRQLPWEMVQSAVSPILRAYRYHSADARVGLKGTRLPEVEPAAASIDRVIADTVVSVEGAALTDLRIRMRNRLRHSLQLRLPEGMEVRSSLLDGQPVKPSRTPEGLLLLPLKRSVGDASFTVQVVLESHVPPQGLISYRDLALPALELPVSSLSWSVRLPARDLYSALEGEVEPQIYAGSGRWYQASGGGGYAGPAFAGGVVSAGETGSMPVKIELPEGGITLHHNRYWVEGDHPITVSFWSMRRWLRAPLALAFFAGLAVAGAVVLARPGTSLREHGLGLVGLVVLGVPLAGLASVWVVALAMTVSVVGFALWRRAPARVVEGLGAWRGSLRGGVTWPEAWTSRNILSRMMLLSGFAFLAFFGGILLLQLVAVLMDPLGG
ncbi:MAG: hypothetical protein H6739_37445 [Alphaproteobacteria bacterium]|nr:hypothetical protein [Alphaproteobacteria bacterium]